MKFLHTMLRVGNLDKSIQFYCNVLGFELLSREDYPDGEFTLAFLGPKSNGKVTEAFLELTFNWGTSCYERGNAFGHIALGIPSMKILAENLKNSGHGFSWGPKPSPSGRSTIAFMTDPDGYSIEFIEAER